MDSQAPTEPKKKSKTSTGELRLDAAIFHRLARTVLHAVSTDTTRAHLNSMHIVARDDRIILEGTDGVCLAIWEHEGDFTPFDILIPRDRVDAFLKALPKQTEQQELFEDGYVRVRHGVLQGSGVRIEFAVPDVDFPDLASVLPKQIQGLRSSPFSLHPIYLNRSSSVFLSSAVKEGASCHPLIEPGESEEDPIRFSSGRAPGLLFVVKPMRLAEDDGEGATVTISAGGKSVDLTPEMGKTLKKAAKKLRGKGN